MGFDRVRRCRMARENNCRRCPHEPPVAFRDFFRDFRERLILQGGAFRVVGHLVDGEFE